MTAENKSNINSGSTANITNSNPSRREAALYSLAVFVLTFAAYGYVVNCGYIWDDSGHVITDKGLWSLDGLRRIWFTTVTQQYYPIVYSSFWAEAMLWGLKPLPSHLINVGLHAANAGLVYLILRRLGVRWAWMAGLVFALHPVHVESVAWISERKNVLSGLFYLLAFSSFLSFRDGLGKRWYAISFGFFFLALASKTVTSTLPMAILIIEWLRGRKIDGRLIAALAPFFILGGASGLLTAWLEVHKVGAEGQAFDLNMPDRFVLAGRVAWFYLYKVLWPANLIFIYPRWQIDGSVWWQWLFPAGVIGVGVMLWALREKIGRGPLAALAFFLITLFPALGFFNVYPFIFSYVADHFQYLASIAPIAAVAAVAGRAFDGKPLMVRAVPAGIIVLILGALTFNQVHIYKDNETLWTATLRKNDAFLAHTNLGNIFARRGEVEAAYNHYMKSIELNKENPIAFNSLSAVCFNMSEDLESRGLQKEALEYAAKAAYYGQEAVRLAPSIALAHNNLGAALLKTGRIDYAITHLNEALRLNPNLGKARANLEKAMKLKETGTSAGK